MSGGGHLGQSGHSSRPSSVYCKGCKNRRTTIDGMNGDIIFCVVMDRRYERESLLADKPLEEKYYPGERGKSTSTTVLSKVDHSTADGFFGKKSIAAVRRARSQIINFIPLA